MPARIYNPMADAPEFYLGLMSGTSLDGVDAVLADFSSGRPRTVAHTHHDFAPELRAELLQLNTAGENELHRAAVAGQHLARAYAASIEDLLLHAGIDRRSVRAAGVHGQTVRHRPDAGYTIQLNAPAVVAELTGINIVADFRSRDIAAGGQGAPLVPAFHAAVFRADTPRAIVNIGGISNLTYLPARTDAAPVIGFDCGPGNVLLDAWAERHLGVAFDRDGAWADSGQVDAALLARLLEEPYFAAPAPKSTGRDQFNPGWLDDKLAGTAAAPQDVQATLTELSAAAIAQAVAAYLDSSGEVVVAGGGAFNRALLHRLAAACAPRRVLSSAELGIAPAQLEALAFAWLAREHLHGRPGNLPAVTGARASRVLGALYPAG